MDSREQFEKYAATKGWEKRHMKQRADGGYEDWGVHPIWLAWCASREAVEIELPEVKDLEIVGIGCTYEDSFVDYLEVVRAIEDAGLKVKPC